MRARRTYTAAALAAMFGMTEGVGMYDPTRRNLNPAYEPNRGKHSGPPHSRTRERERIARQQARDADRRINGRAFRQGERVGRVWSGCWWPHATVLECSRRWVTVEYGNGTTHRWPVRLTYRADY